jgi:hypothetical protein
VVAWLGGLGCASKDERDSTSDAGQPWSFELGVPVDDVDNEYSPFSSGDNIPVVGTVQGLAIAAFAVRIRAVTAQPNALKVSPVDQVTVALRLRLNGAKKDAVNAGPEVPQRPSCREDGYCYISPLMIDVSELVELDSTEQQEVDIELTISDAPKRSYTQIESSTGMLHIIEVFE